eukprot:539811_1
MSSIEENDSKTQSNINQWQCHVCTFIQSKHHSNCTMCGAPRKYVIARPLTTDPHILLEAIRMMVRGDQVIEDVLCDSDNINNCQHLKQLIEFLKKSNNDDIQTDIENVPDILADYLHFVECHSKKEHDAFEFIFNNLSFCNINKCPMFDRIYRDRNKMNTEVTEVTEVTEHLDHSYSDIMDKIHVYFCHSYDMRYRLTGDQQTLISNAKLPDFLDTDEKKSIESKSVCRYLVNPLLTKMRQTLPPKQHIDTHVISRNYKKYNQVFSNQNNQHYCFGFHFKYGYDGEKRLTLQPKEIISVVKHYDNLKTELLDNDFYILTISQFNNEYTKAIMHFDSPYCKNKFRPFSYPMNDQKYFIDIDIILSLMIYSNFTDLQYELSKTYRADGGMKHKYFFHWGKYLKMALERFGTKGRDANVYSYFHGVSEFIFFPEYVTVDSLYFFCPLSTSSALEVALNFTNQNNGLVVEFAPAKECDASHFSLSWLSDYAAEKEYFFIQTGFGLQMNNILNAQTCFQYDHIFKALKQIEQITATKVRGYYDQGTHREYCSVPEVFQQSINTQVSDELVLLILSKREKFGTDDPLFMDICNSYFKNKKKLIIDYARCANEHNNIFQRLRVENHEWINIKLCYALFPNIEIISISYVNLNSFIFDNLLKYLQSAIQNIPLKTVTISSVQPSKLSAKDAIDRFAGSFRKLNFFLTADLESNSVALHRDHGILESALFLISNIEKNKYFRDTNNNEIVDTMDKLIRNGMEKCIGILRENKCNEVDHNLSMKLLKDCSKKTRLCIYGDQFTVNHDSYLFKTFWLSNYQWIRLRMIDKVFPALQHIELTNMSLSGDIMDRILDDIFNYLSTKSSKINEIILRLGAKSNINYRLHISVELKQLFRVINFEIEQYKHKALFSTHPDIIGVKISSVD